MMETEVLPASDEAAGAEDPPFWHKLTDPECDLLYMEHFAKLQPYEQGLFRRKWYDYRFQHPLRATYEFAQAYREAYRYMTAIRFDRDKAKFVKGFSGDDFMQLKAQSRTGFVRARMVADQYGIPYDFWCREAMRYAEMMSWTNMPRPTQLYGPEIVAHVRERWAREQEVAPRRATHPHYAPQSYVDNPDQADYQRYLLAQIEGANAPWRLASVMDELASVSLATVSETLLREAQRVRDLFSHN